MNNKPKKNDGAKGKQDEEKNDPRLKTYLLKDIEETVWDKFAIRARGMRMNIKEAMSILVTQFANGDIEFKRSE